MLRRKRRWGWKDVVLAAMGLLMVGAAYTSVLIVRRQAVLAAVSRYNLTWLTSQAGLEVSRLHGAIALFLLPDGGVDVDELDLRLAIVENRVQLMESGEFAEFVAGSAELGEIVALFRDGVRTARAELGEPPAPARPRRLLELIGALGTPVARLTAAANAYGSAAQARDRHDLDRLHWLLGAILLATTACGLGLVAAMSWHNRLLNRAQDRVKQQNEALQARDAELQVRNGRFDAALSNMSQALCMTNVAGQLVVYNARFTRLFGLDPDSLPLGCDAAAAFRAGAGRRSSAPTLIELFLLQQARAAADGPSATFTVEDEAGRAIAVFQETMPDGGWVATFEDITDRRRTEAQIHYMAHHDGLTGLPNRTQFRARLCEALDRHQASGTSVALLCLDLDRFKQVNDVYGHPFGDQLLKLVGTRLNRCIRDSDVVARLGGDEFAILQAGAAQPQAAEAAAHRIVRELSAPYDIDGQHIVIGASVGIALATGASPLADTLLKNADIALYRAKAAGRGTHCLYHAEMGAELRERRILEDDLRGAQDRGELRVFYQPLYALAPDRVCGFEALLRWEHPAKGLVSPATFVPVAEEAGLIVEMGEWVLRRACADAASWPADIKVAVNLSPLQFGDARLAARVERVLAETGLDPSRLELEITESVLLQNSATVLSMLRDLRNLGVRLALDDFGTGYSSLSYLHAFPFNKVKIDRSFVRQMTAEPTCEAIVKAVIGLATCLGMTTTAEGVENEDQFRRLRQIGCTELQGFLIDRPQPLHGIGGWVSNTRRPFLPGALPPPAEAARHADPGDGAVFAELRRAEALGQVPK